MTEGPELLCGPSVRSLVETSHPPPNSHLDPQSGHGDLSDLLKDTESPTLISHPRKSVWPLVYHRMSASSRPTTTTIRTSRLRRMRNLSRVTQRKTRIR